MSRRIKIDRRCAVGRNTVIDIIRFVDYPGIPEEFVNRLIGIKKFLEWVGNCIEKKHYRFDSNREGMAYSCYSEADNIEWLLKEYHLIADDDPYALR